MDEVDIAQAFVARWDRQALEQHLACMPKGESARECEECGEDIPAARRLAARGCTRCLSCQERHERIVRGGRG